MESVLRKSTSTAMGLLFLSKREPVLYGPTGSSQFFRNICWILMEVASAWRPTPPLFRYLVTRMYLKMSLSMCYRHQEAPLEHAR